MSPVNMLRGAALASIAALSIHTPGLARQNDGSPREEASTVEMREQATDNALLEALLARRAEVARSAGSTDAKRAALAFLDARIAQFRSRRPGLR
jgi:hypothetical protein